jgi:hypothetical protein
LVVRWGGAPHVDKDELTASGSGATRTVAAATAVLVGTILLLVGAFILNDGLVDADLVIDARTGAVRQPARPLADCAVYGAVLAGGTVCAVTTFPAITAFRRTGEITVQWGTLGGAALTSLPVNLGVRAEHPSGDGPLIRFVAAPGAVVVYTRDTPPPAGRTASSACAERQVRSAGSGTIAGCLITWTT